MNHLAAIVLFSIGRTPVTLGAMVTGVAMVVAGFVAARLAGLAIRRARARVRHGGSALFIVEKLITYGLVMLGFVTGLSTMGLNLSSLAVFAGAIGVGVGLGLQGVVKEFVSGLVLIFDRVLNVGDYVDLGDGVRGLVQEIGPRAVRVRTNDFVDIVVPNSKFIERRVVNWTLGSSNRRIHVPFSVAYGSDRSRVREVVLEAARSVSFTSPETEQQKSQVWLVGFGDSGLNFELLVWPTPEAAKRPAAMHAAYTWAIADALERAGVEVPFPQMDLRLRSLFGQEGREALGALGLQPADGPPEPAERLRPRPHTNDAAEELAQAERETSGRPPGGPEAAGP